MPFKNIFIYPCQLIILKQDHLWKIFEYVSIIIDVMGVLLINETII